MCLFPPGGRRHSLSYRGVAQLVARLLWEQEARGSSPRTPTTSEQSPLSSVSAVSLRLSAKTAPAPLLLLPPHDPLRWARAGTPFLFFPMEMLPVMS